MLQPVLFKIKYILIFLPALVYFIVIDKYALNIPFLDDYAAILDFLCQYRETHGINKFLKLFDQHGEHRILSSRIIYVLYEMFSGEIDFRTIIFIGNIQLLLTFVIAITFIKKCLPDNWIITSFIVGLCLFDLSNSENATFAMACMQNYGIFFLLSAGLFFYDKQSSYAIIPAIIVQIVCTFSSGNGIVASFFIVLFNVLNKNILKSISSLLVLLIFSPIYFINYYTPPSGHPATDITKIVNYFILFVSGHFNCPLDYMKIIITIIVLMGLIILIPIGKKLSIKQPHAFFITSLGFILSSMALTSVFRCSYGDLPASRYLIYPHYLTSILFIFLFIKLQGKKSMLSVSVAIVVINIINYMPDFVEGNKNFVRQRDTLKSTDYCYPDKNVARAISEHSCQLNIYCLEKHR